MTSDLVPRQEPKLFKVGDRVLAKGGFSVVALEEHLKQQLVSDVNKWTPIESLCRVFFGRVSEGNRRKMRNRVTSTSRELLKRGIFVLKDYSPRGSITRIKILNPSNSTEQVCANLQLERMEARGEVSKVQAEAMRKIIGAA